MRDFCSAFIFAASSRMSPASSGMNSARVRQSRPGRGEREGGPADEVDEYAFSEAVLEHLGRELGAEIQGQQEPLPAHLRAGHARCQRLQRVLEDGPLEANLFEEVLVIDHAQYRLDRRHRERVAPEGGAVVAGPQGRVLFLRHHRAHGETAAEALGARERVREDPDPLICVQMPGASRPGLHLVEDEEGAVLVARFAQPLQETLRRDVHATFALDRLDQDRGGLLSDELLRRLEVAKGRVDEAVEHGSEAFLQGWLGGRAQAAVGAAVEGPGEAQDLVLPRAVFRTGVLAGELYRGLDALGTGVAEEDSIEVGGPGEHLGHLGLDRDLVQVRTVDELLRLLLYGLHERRVAVA